MKLPRDITEDEVLGLKADTHGALKLAGGPEKFALATRVQKAALSKYSSPSEPDAVIPLDIAIEIDRRLGAPMMIAAAAALLGYRLVPDEGEDMPASITEADARELRRKAGALESALDDALEDGQVDRHELRDIRSALDDKIISLRRVRRKVA